MQVYRCCIVLFVLGWNLRFLAYQTFVAVDDIKFVNCTLAPDRGGQCNAYEVGCINGACVAGNKVFKIRISYASLCLSLKMASFVVLSKEFC